MITQILFIVISIIVIDAQSVHNNTLTHTTPQTTISHWLRTDDVDVTKSFKYTEQVSYELETMWYTKKDEISWSCSYINHNPISIFMTELARSIVRPIDITEVKIIANTPYMSKQMALYSPKLTTKYYVHCCTVERVSKWVFCNDVLNATDIKRCNIDMTPFDDHSYTVVFDPVINSRRIELEEQLLSLKVDQTTNFYIDSASSSVGRITTEILEQYINNEGLKLRMLDMINEDRSNDINMLTIPDIKSVTQITLFDNYAIQKNMAIKRTNDELQNPYTNNDENKPNQQEGINNVNTIKLDSSSFNICKLYCSQGFNEQRPFYCYICPAAKPPHYVAGILPKSVPSTYIHPDKEIC